MSEIEERATHEVREVARGRSWHTPFAALGGGAVVVGGVAAFVNAVARILWLALGCAAPAAGSPPTRARESPPGLHLGRGARSLALGGPLPYPGWVSACDEGR
jgi:hypothetical protein